jgi:hypothetical protein
MFWVFFVILIKILTELSLFNIYIYITKWKNGKIYIENVFYHIIYNRYIFYREKEKKIINSFIWKIEFKK